MLIRDPIHGDISLSDRETAVLDLPALQRMRRVKQLGTAYLVYPGCLHTRFDHSLGTGFVAKRIVSELRRRGSVIDDELAEGVAIAGLLHDVTHVPFGHTLEDERCLFPRHDKGSRFGRLLAGGLGESLRHLGLLETVSAVLGIGDSTLVPAWASQIVSSTIDADLLDYLHRDATFAGIAQRYDDRIFHQFAVDDEQLVIQMAKHGMERSDVRSETIQLLRMRYFLTERVYYHHTKVAAGAMISKAVELAHRHGAMGEDLLLDLGDEQLFEQLLAVPDRASPDPGIAALVERLRLRRLLKRGYVVSSRAVAAPERAALVHKYHESAANRAAAEAELAAALGCDGAEVIVYCPALTVMKEAAVLVRTPTGITPLNEYDGEGRSEIGALEEAYDRLWRFFVFVPESVVERAGPLAEEIFGFPNEHAPNTAA